MPVLAAALALLLCLAPPAIAGPGGSLSGELSVEWSSGPAPAGNAWNGSASLALEGGDEATARAAAALRDSGRTYREVRPFFVQASQLTGLVSESARQWGGPEHCWDVDAGTQVPGETRTGFRAGELIQRLVPFTVDQPDVDLLGGRGEVEIGLYTDNPGYAEGSDTFPFPAAGEYFMPVPGTVTATTSRSHCGEGREETGPAPVFNTRSDGLVPFAFALWLNEAKLPLRRVDGAWRIELEHTESSTTDEFEDALPLAMRYRANLRMSGDLRDMEARCKVPGARLFKQARSVRAVRRLLARAGFPRARFGGRKPYVGLRRSHFKLDPDFTSSGHRRCGDRGRFIRAVPWPR